MGLRSQTSINYSNELKFILLKICLSYTWDPRVFSQQMRERDDALSREVESLKSKIQELEQLARGRGLAGVFNLRPSHIEEGKSPTPAWSIVWSFGSKMIVIFSFFGAKNHMPSVNQKPRLLAENEVESFENFHWLIRLWSKSSIACVLDPHA